MLNRNGQVSGGRYRSEMEGRNCRFVSRLDELEQKYNNQMRMFKAYVEIQEEMGTRDRDLRIIHKKAKQANKYNSTRIFMF